MQNAPAHETALSVGSPVGVRAVHDEPPKVATRPALSTAAQNAVVPHETPVSGAGRPSEIPTLAHALVCTNACAPKVIAVQPPPGVHDAATDASPTATVDLDHVAPASTAACAVDDSATQLLALAHESAVIGPASTPPLV